MPLSERRKLVSSDSHLSKSAQCRILGIHRSGLYYENRSESALNLELMAKMDKHYYHHPYKGAPRMHVWLTKDEGYSVNYKRVARLYYEVMGLPLSVRVRILLKGLKITTNTRICCVGCRLSVPIIPYSYTTLAVLKIRV